MPRSAFVYATCQVGAEPYLKSEAAAAGLRFAFSRPGFVTFKVLERGEPVEVTADWSAPLIFARSQGACFGGVKGETPLEVARGVARKLAELGAGERALVHVFSREKVEPGDEPDHYDPEAPAKVALEALEEVGGLRLNAAPAVGEVVWECVVVDELDWWVAAHVHRPWRRPTPGGRPALVVPPEAPSRVWLKVEEALWWSKAPMKEGEMVLDIGCSPGGGAWALLERGLWVVGVDPAKVAPQVGAHPRFMHRTEAFELLDPRSLPGEVAWIVFDVNLAPTLTLKHLARLGAGLPHLKGALVTLKLNQPGLWKKIPWMLDQIRAMGLTEIKATQMFANRREFFVYARR
jgi:23S rRNA (cytidine2498-2'-O)-methyltransferase